MVKGQQVLVLHHGQWKDATYYMDGITAGDHLVILASSELVKVTELQSPLTPDNDCVVCEIEGQAGHTCTSCHANVI